MFSLVNSIPSGRHLLLISVAPLNAGEHNTKQKEVSSNGRWLVAAARDFESNTDKLHGLEFLPGSE